MSVPQLCPYCGHPPSPNHARLGMAVVCERCQKVFTPTSASSSLEPLVEPEMIFGSRSVPDVDVPSGASAFLSIFLIVGLMVLLCGGIGGYIAINARKRMIAAAENVEKINQQQQRELELEHKPLPRPKPISPRPASSRDFTPPVIPPIAQPPPVEPRIEKLRVQPTSKSLDQLLTELNAEKSQRPVWVTLQELARLPVQEDRKVDVSSALDRHLRSTDASTLNAATKAAINWGTEWNGEALLALIDSPNAIIRWDAMRALAKIRPTMETAELLLAQAHHASNHPALRDALKDLGPVGEQVIFDYLESNDRPLKQSLLHLLGEVGGQTAIEPLEKLIRRETDIALKSQAEFALRRIQARTQ